MACRCHPARVHRVLVRCDEARALTRRRQEAAAILAGCTAGRMRVAEAKESQCPAEPELTFQRDRVRLAAERTSRLATRKEPEAEGTAGMDDRRNDGRGARMASEGGGHGSGPTATRLAQRTNSIEAIEVEWPNEEIKGEEIKEEIKGVRPAL